MTDESKRDKLIAAKESWAREGRRPKGGAEAGAGRRLPPGQREVHDFPVLDLGQQPNLSRKEWRLSVSGLVERPIDWSWDDFLAQPQVTLVSDIHCVTSWSRYDNTWQGVSARHLLDVARPRPEAKFLMLKSFDGYSTNVPLARFAEEDVLLAHSWEGRALERQHGGPVRVVLPSLYFWKSAKWLRHITVMAQDAPGFWEARGYHMNGDPWDEERYGTP